MKPKEEGSENLEDLEEDKGHKVDTPILITQPQEPPQESPQYARFLKWAGIAVAVGVVLYLIYNNMSPPPVLF